MSPIRHTYGGKHGDHDIDTPVQTLAHLQCEAKRMCMVHPATLQIHLFAVTGKSACIYLTEYRLVTHTPSMA